ncbi:MAG: family 10 glycosylhydrolase [Verrucomicrobia bacterium]|nr:family 10 glycosylhydrolase [Verrucomicrobiota bacterium]
MRLNRHCRLISQLSAVVLFCFLSVAGSVKAAPVVLDSFAYSSDEAERRWIGKDGSPRVVSSSTGLELPCPFSTGRDRVYWDREVKLDLSAFTSFELDLTCYKPTALRHLGLYFKSGNGWFVCNRPLRRAGRQRLSLLKTDFSVEGSPSGWHRIDTIRLSPWKGSRNVTSVMVHSLSARRDSIMLIQGTSSTPDDGERAAASKVTQRLSRWLKDMDVAHGILTDDEVTDDALANASVLVLGYNPALPKQEFAAIRRFAERGGKLFVCYSADRRLADLMKLKLGDYTASEFPDRWNAITFGDSEEWHVPEKVYQQSWNIRPVYPADKEGRVIAYWESGAGKKSDDPAVVATDSGIWVTHILLDDGHENKKRMVAALLAHLDPGIWPAVARHALNDAGRIDSFASLMDATSSISSAGRGLSSARAISVHLASAEKEYEKALSHYEHVRYPEVLAACGRLRDELVKAYALTQTQRDGEFRGVWDHHALGLYPGDWDRTAELLAGHGITAIFPNVFWGATAHYRSEVLPRSDTERLYGDQLADCITAAHKRGLQVHAWKVCWKLDGAPDSFMKQMSREGRLQMTSSGKELPWLSPSHPANRELELRAIAEVVQKYNVDGIHLDYIRFPMSKGCYSPASRREFEKWLGAKVDRWPGSVSGSGKLTGKFREWRRELITGHVANIRETINRINPRVKLSAAVFGKYPECSESVGQDWGTWLKRGYVDFVCPMNYTENPSQFAAWTHDQLSLPGAKGRVYPGIGVTAAESQLGPDRVLEQIGTLRRLGAAGFVLFDLDTTLRDQTLPALSLGASKKN